MQALADHCGMSPERVVEAIELRNSQWSLSLDGLTGGESGDDGGIQLGREEAGFGQLENRQLLDRLLSRLSEGDRRIIELRFGAEMTQAEIADESASARCASPGLLARTLGRLRVWARTSAA